MYRKNYSINKMLLSAAVALALTACSSDKDANPAVATNKNPSVQNENVKEVKEGFTPATTPSNEVVADANASKPARQVTLSGQGTEEVFKKLKEKYPSLELNAVREVELGSEQFLYEFALPGGVKLAYTNANVDFILAGGELLTGSEADMRNITREAVQKKINEAYSALNKNLAIPFVYGKGERELFLFSDPDCVFCAGLEEIFANTSDALNATVYLVPYPLKGLHPDAERKARAILCSENPGLVWHDWMRYSYANREQMKDDTWNNWKAKTGFNDSVTNCEKANVMMSYSSQMVDTFGLNQTPSLIFPGAGVWAGMPSFEEIQKAFAYVEEIKAGRVPVMAPTPNNSPQGQGQSPANQGQTGGFKPAVVPGG